MKPILSAMMALIVTASAAQAATLLSSAGLDLSIDQTQSAGVQAFAERSDVTVAANEITVDFLVGDNLSVGDTRLGISNFASGPQLAAGQYDSYLLHFDPFVTSSVSNFAIDFGATIVGLILSNSGTQRLLNQSDSRFGLASSFDTTVGRRAETNDSFTLTSASAVNFNFFAGANYTDNVRILTVAAPVPAAIPLPASLPLLLAGVGGFALFRRRR